jgi:hypothetical protein
MGSLDELIRLAGFLFWRNEKGVLFGWATGKLIAKK